MTYQSAHSQNTAISRGIKSVGIGKRGSKSLDPQLIEDILIDIKSGNVPAIVQGVFFGALFLKGITEEERQIEDAFAPGILNDPQQLTETLTGESPDFVKTICARLFKGETLAKEEAERLGDFLFSDQPGDGARGIIASILRVRYETPAEYEGLLTSMQKTIEDPFRAPVPNGLPIIQMAEPFDGVDHSNLITPLTAQFIQRLNFRVVSLVGRNSGPKFGNNLLDLAKSLKGSFLTKNDDLADENPAFG